MNDLDVAIFAVSHKEFMKYNMKDIDRLFKKSSGRPAAPDKFSPTVQPSDCPSTRYTDDSDSGP